MRFRVASYNIHGCRGRRGFSPAAIAEVLRELECDVLGLQEVGDVSGRVPLVDQAHELASATSMSVLFEPSLTLGARRYGIATLTRHPVTGSRAYDLSVPGREQRRCIRADLALEGSTQVHVFNLHLGLSWRERRHQTARLLSEDVLEDAAVAFPTVVMGDFNFWLPGPQPRPLLSALVDLGASMGHSAPTYPARFPLLRLDRIYLGPGVLGRWIRVHDSPKAREASDHLPLTAEVELLPTPMREDRFP